MNFRTNTLSDKQNGLTQLAPKILETKLLINVYSIW